MTHFTYAFDEALEFLCTATIPEEVLGFQLSDETRTRIQFLLEAKRKDRLTAKEQAELQAFQDVALYIHMRKVQARKRLM